MVSQSMNRAVELFSRQPWTKPLDSTLANLVSRAFSAAGPAGLKAKDFLNGTWLGHPLHPVLTDVPTGAWTVACLLDAMDTLAGRSEFQAGADTAILVGTIGAVGSALTGLADWQYLVGRPRREGLLHGLMNLSAVGLFATSYGLRRSGARGAGQAASILGYSVATAAAYLGGTLVYADHSGVDHAPTEDMPTKFTPVIDDVDLPEGKLTAVEAKGTPVLLYRTGDRLYAIANTCTHLGGPLNEGELADGSVICPWHGSRFALSDGHIINGPATFPQPCFETRVRQGKIEVRLAP
ncbi:MAG TPA: Rieske 2Fe-2S domain-containing protein [Thermomicrobiaceae bacterium]|nr:Rieske 2Fe-2S domain-containing protein [Thermomicrobiaceae bacterium]